MQNDDQSVLENQIHNLNEQLEEKDQIIKSTKEYLLALESENKRINRDYNNYKKESVANIKNLKKDNKKLKNDIKNVNKKLKNIQEKNKELNKEISIIKSTFSWKITKTIKKFKK